MAHIVAGEFDEFAAAEAALDALRSEGFAASQLTMLYLNAPGQPAKFPIGGDQLEDTEVESAGAGAVKGGALGKDPPRPEAPTVSPAGVVVAVHVPTPPERERATLTFWRHRAHSIEVAEGTWRNGTWQDFDPVSIPRWRKAPAA